MLDMTFRSSMAGLAALTLLLAGCEGQSTGGATATGGDDIDLSASATGGTGFANKDAGSTAAEDGTGGPVIKNFSVNIGLSCAGNIDCPGDVDCYGDRETPSAICTIACSDDSGCPAAFACKGPEGGDRACVPRTFCATCTEDAQCGDGGRCVTMSEGKFCSRDCTKKTGCPRFAQCQEVDEGGLACVHTSGTCQGDGSLCTPCAATGKCAEGGSCLTFSYTGEAFCSAACDGTTCATGYACANVQTGPETTSSQCVPDSKTAPKCVASLHGTMEVGDILEDFEMVGYLDTDSDGSLLTTSDGPPELARRIKFSEYASIGGYKAVLFNVAAGWCGPCQQETTGFKKLMAAYPNLGIYQVIFDGAKQNTKPTLTLAKSWIKNLNAAGAVGVDAEKRVVPYNTAGSTPLNMIVDAQTRKILKKFNGAPAGSLNSTVAPYLK